MTDPFTSATAIYRNAARLGANSGPGFVVSADHWTLGRFIRVMALPIFALFGLIVWSFFR